LLAADTTTLAPAVNANKIALVKSNFTPSEALDFTTLTLADFDGSTPILGTAPGPQPEGLDPATSDSIIDLPPAAGNYRWETTGLTNLPQTIYGYVLTDNAGTTMLASALLDAPIALSAINQRIDIGDVSLRQLAGSIS
jgi:hypothetical protein